ncbi:hypothetical protein Clacol_002404 [Clathrus columnatus]|uniref:Uncharacterized protein n=1 Tax=Clathrus columnatus TaxID=1419009 RepID=A0AAV5A6M4_9AGAM|nr:hypothetical protein Clacol_002404 [Clathrus columnatus]
MALTTTVVDMGISQSKFYSNPEKFATRIEKGQGSNKIKEYDFVIVGGGSVQILLIEAGKRFVDVFLKANIIVDNI